MIQNWIHRIEEGGGLRFLKYGLILLVFAGLLVTYNLRGFKNMANPEAMDAAQLARNLATHRGYNTLLIRPLSIYLLEKAEVERNGPLPLGVVQDRARINGMHPDLANPPVYPVLLAGLMKISPKFQYQAAAKAGFWNRKSGYWMYEPDFLISFFNQLLFFASVILVFFLARRLFDGEVAWTSAGIFLATDLFWRFSISGLSTMLLVLIFLLLSWCVLALEKCAREGQRGPAVQISLAAAIGFLVGIGCLTRYSLGWLILPTLFFLVLFGGRQRVVLCLTALAVFAVIVGPWIMRNYRLSHTPFGVAGYVVYQGNILFQEHRLERSLHPDLSLVSYRLIWNKFVSNAGTCLQEDLPKLGGSWVSAFFLVGLLLPYRNLSLRRLRYFVLLCLPVLLVAQAVGKTALSDEVPVVNSENLLVIVAPLALIFGVSLFFILLDQLNLPAVQFRKLIIGVFCVFLCLPTAINLLSTPRGLTTYTDYDLTRIQMFSGWMKPNELVMSDVPWAVAWYGDRQCVWLTLNAQKAFGEIHDYRKPVKALYLTPVTIDARFLSGWVRADELSWGSFVIDGFANGEVPPKFPLRRVPRGFLPEQLFITDIDRWNYKDLNSIPTQ
jgi:hypothetical protein